MQGTPCARVKDLYTPTRLPHPIWQFVAKNLGVPMLNDKEVARFYIKIELASRDELLQ